MRTVPTNSVVMIRAYTDNRAPASLGSLGFLAGRPSDAISLQPGPCRFLQVAPFGVGSPGTTFVVRVVGLRPGVEGGRRGFHQLPLFEGTAVLGGATGSDSATIGSAERMASEVTDPAVGSDGVQYTRLSAGQSTTILVDMQGCQTFVVRIGPGNATNGNALLGASPN